MDLSIKINKLNISFGNQILFDNASLEISKPGFYAIMGRNGCGKTTLFKAMINQLVLDEKSISITCEGKELDKQKITYVAADPIVFDTLSVLENLQLFCEDNKRIDELLEKFEITHLKNRLAKRCSAGEKQRISLVRALLEDNPILLMDEATSHLDDFNSEKALEIIKEISKNRIVIFATHYIKEATKFADAIIEISNYHFQINELKENTNEFKFEVKDISNKFNRKIYNKLMFWKGKLIFTLLFLVFSSIICYSSAVAFTSKEKITYEYHKDSSEISIARYEKITDFGVTGKDLETDCLKYTENVYEAYYPTVMGGVFERIDQNSSFAHIFNGIIITDEWNGKPLNDFEIALSSDFFMYKKDDFLIFEDDQWYYPIYGKKLKIVGYEGNNHDDYSYFDNVYSGTRFFITETTARFLGAGDYFCEQYILFDYRFVTLSNGRVPTASNEVLVNTTEDNHQIGEEVVIGSSTFTIVGSTNAYVVSKYYFYDEIGFFNAYPEKYSVTDKLNKSVGFYANDMDIRDLEFLCDNGYILMDDKTLDQIQFEKKNDNRKIIFTIVFSAGVIALSIILILGLLLEKKDTSEKYALLKETCITQKEVNRSVLLNNLFTYLGYVILFIGAYLGIYYYEKNVKNDVYSIFPSVLLSLIFAVLVYHMVHCLLFMKRSAKR